MGYGDTDKINLYVPKGTTIGPTIHVHQDTMGGGHKRI